MSACIKRDYSYWSTCPCDDCDRDRRRKLKMSRVYGYRRASSSEAWERIDLWLEQGFSPTWIASAAGIAARGVQSATEEERRNGHRRNLGPTISARILAADIWTATAGRCSATGTRRRLQALAFVGWASSHIHEETGLSVVTICSVQRGEVNQIAPRLRNPIVEFYDKHCMTIGPSSAAKHRARKLGWAGPLAWDDIDFDPEPIGAPAVEIDEVAIERRMAGDKSVRLTRQERTELARRWYESDKPNNDCWPTTGINIHREIRRGQEVA